MKKIIFCILSVILYQQAYAQTQPEITNRMTLEECIAYAIDNNYGRRSIELNEEQRLEIYKQSKFERLPGLSATLSESLGHNKGNEASYDGSYSASTSVTLFDGLTISNTIKQNLLLLEQAGFRTDQYDIELTIQILQAFLSVVSNEELLRYQTALLEASEEQMRQGQAMLEVESIIESDYLILESQYANDLNNITESRINRDNSLLTLKALMAMELSQPLDIIYPDSAQFYQLTIVPDRNYVVYKALTTLPSVSISEYDVEIAKYNVKLAEANYYPTVSLGASIGTGHNGDFSDYGNQLRNRRSEQVGLTVSIPIFNKNRTRSQVNQSKISLYQAELDNRQTLLDVERTVTEEYNNVISLRGRYEASDIRRNAYYSSFEAYRSMFNYGAITAVELLQQQNNYISALNDYIQNKYTFILNRKILDIYMGELIKM